MNKKFTISLLAALMITSQSCQLINAQTTLGHQSNLVMENLRTNEQLPNADIFNVDFSDGTKDQSPLQNQLGKTVGTPLIEESNELHKNIAKFNGSSAYLYPFTTEKYDKMKQNVTMECMVKFNSIPSGEHDIFSNQQSGGIGLGLNGGKLTFFAHVGGAYRQPTASIKAGQWYHIVGVVDGKNVKLYVNGILQGTVMAPNAGISYPSSSNAWNMVLGGDSNNSQGAEALVDADLSFARIYGMALDDTTIANLNTAAFDGVEIETLKPQEIGLGLISSDNIGEEGEWNLNLHANEKKLGSVDTFEYDLVYNDELLEYENAQHVLSGVTITEAAKGRLHIKATSALAINDFNDFGTTRLGKLTFKTKTVEKDETTVIKTENFKAFVQGKDVTNELDQLPMVEKEITIYDKGQFDLNGDGVIGAGDIALADDSNKKTIASLAKIYPYKHVVILTIDGGGQVWNPDAMYYAENNAVLPTKRTDQSIMAKRTNTYAMDLMNKEFATSYSAKAVTPSISAQNYSAILHGVPWLDVPNEYQVTNDIAGAKYYADFGKEKALYPSVFKTIGTNYPSRLNAAFAEWTPILNGIIEPDAQVITKGSASKQSFYDVANYIKTDAFKNTAVVYMQSDWMDHVGHSTGYYNNTFYQELVQYDDFYKSVVDALKETGNYDDTLIIANADHGGNGTNHGSSDPSNMDIFIGVGGQTVNSGKRLNGGTNADISPLALSALRINKPASMTGSVFDENAFLSQEELSKKHRDIEKITMTVSGKQAELELTNPKSQTRVIDTEIALNGNQVASIDAKGGTILCQDVENDKLKLTISYDHQPTTLATINLKNNNEIKLSEIMLGDEMGNEIYPDIENKKSNIDQQIDTRSLKIAVEIAKEANLSDVVPVVVNEFNAALANAENVLANNNATQQEVNDAFERLATIMQYLEFKKGDKATLEAFVNKVDELDDTKYTENTWAVFKTALNNATAVIANENTIQEEINETYDALVRAFLDLRLVPNKDALKDLIDQAKALNEPALANAIAMAKTVLDNPEATQVEIDNATIALTNAINNIVKSENKTPNTKQGDITPAGSIKTSDNTNIVGMTSLLGLSVAAYLITKKRKD